MNASEPWMEMCAAPDHPELKAKKRILIIVYFAVNWYLVFLCCRSCIGLWPLCWLSWANKLGVEWSMHYKISLLGLYLLWVLLQSTFGNVTHQSYAWFLCQHPLQQASLKGLACWTERAALSCNRVLDCNLFDLYFEHRINVLKLQLLKLQSIELVFWSFCLASWSHWCWSTLAQFYSSLQAASFQYPSSNLISKLARVSTK